ncbi:MAG: SpoIVB peptidase [Chitinophagales bacterium]
MPRKSKKITGIILSIIIFLLSIVSPLNNLLNMPSATQLVVGEKVRIALPLPPSILNRLRLQIEQEPVEMNTSGNEVLVDRQEDGYELWAVKPGKVDLTVKIFGYIPLKSILVESLPARKMMVGGHSIGVLMQSNGIMIVGYAPMTGKDGKKVYPARNAGIRLGDCIFKVDDRNVNSENQLADIINNDGNLGKSPELLVKREGKARKIKIKPVYCPETGRYRVGLYVRDGVAGVGTLTFWDPISLRFAALGHIVVDSDTKQAIAVKQGRIVSAAVQTIQPGRPGFPGQKLGVFDRTGGLRGTILTNSNFGIFGTTNEPSANQFFPLPVQVAYAHQVRKGPAEMLTVIRGNRIERFKIIIEKVYPYRKNGKGMIIRINDPRLLSASGGIVQGMSGSPIIQNNRLIGAVTHVFLNNPAKGYGVFMDSMVESIDNM